MSEMFYKLDICVQVLEQLNVIDLQKRINTRWEEHICAIWLSVERCLLQHYGDYSAKVNKHSELGFGSLVFVELG